MKDYSNATVKRAVQNLLLNDVTIPRKGKFLGLADDFGIDSYKELIQKEINPKRMTFVGNTWNVPEMSERGVKYLKDNLERESTRNQYNIIDADFCDTYVNSGKLLKYVFDDMNKGSSSKLLMFTFGVRKVSTDNTLNFLKELFYKDSFEFLGKQSISIQAENSYKPFIKKLVHNQSIFEESSLYLYRDTAVMLSGAISWKGVIWLIY